MSSLLRLTILVMTLGLTSLLAHDLFTHVQTAGQKQDRVLKKKQWRNEPIKIMKVKVKGETISLGENHPGDDDWFRDLTIDVKNTSDKTIVFIDLSINFPPTEAVTGEHAASDHLLYGDYPSTLGETVIRHPDQPALKPGDSATIVLTDYDGTREFLNQVGKHNIKEIEISIEDVVFDDGTKFSGGQMWRRDPNNPQIWIPGSRQSSSLRGEAAIGKCRDIHENRFCAFLLRAP